MLQKIIKNKVPIFMLLALLIPTLFLLFNEQPLRTQEDIPLNAIFKKEGKSKRGVVLQSQNSGGSKESVPANSPKREQALASVDSKKFSYKKEAEKIQELAKRLPQSKASLLLIINEVDPYKNKLKRVKPHSLAEITQNQMGALKVLALRALLENSSSKDNTLKDLASIVENAQDPTIKKIAQAVLDSAKQGRSFIDDFLDGISNKPLANNMDN